MHDLIIFQEALYLKKKDLKLLKVISKGLLISQKVRIRVELTQASILIKSPSMISYMKFYVQASVILLKIH